MTTKRTQINWRPRDTFGARLRLIRGELGIDIGQAAERCGLPVATWSNWERTGASPRNLLDVVLKIEQALDVDRDWLMWGGPLERRGPKDVPPRSGAERRRSYPRHRGQDWSKVTPLRSSPGVLTRSAA